MLNKKTHTYLIYNNTLIVFIKCNKLMVVIIITRIIQNISLKKKFDLKAWTHNYYFNYHEKYNRSMDE